MIKVEIRLKTHERLGPGDHRKKGEISTNTIFHEDDVESILTFMIKVLDFNGFDLRSKVLEVDHLGKVVSIEHRGRK
jgi:hypothetical protein